MGASGEGVLGPGALLPLLLPGHKTLEREVALEEGQELRGPALIPCSRHLASPNPCPGRFPVCRATLVTGRE